eukprot:GEMP01110569.1.p1 GENE.GEMP01110569.1~~GEMP01110569.1.p1  ORF type:complete len:130 (-),score=5.84 GEMP01110569.1:151-540(-)
MVAIFLYSISPLRALPVLPPGLPYLKRDERLGIHRGIAGGICCRIATDPSVTFNSLITVGPTSTTPSANECVSTSWTRRLFVCPRLEESPQRCLVGALRPCEDDWEGRSKLSSAIAEPADGRESCWPCL